MEDEVKANKLRNKVEKLSFWQENYSNVFVRPLILGLIFLGLSLGAILFNHNFILSVVFYSCGSMGFAGALTWLILNKKIDKAFENKIDELWKEINSLEKDSNLWQKQLEESWGKETVENFAVYIKNKNTKINNNSEDDKQPVNSDEKLGTNTSTI